ncbi:MAG: histidinol dehydrogenase, partial [Candidatus Omnitrophica bacterium]|nr:histidinol dehydrogenase [Candidatus Omnitrophota bacterium]
MRRIKRRKELEAILKKRASLAPGLEKKVRGIISAVKKDGDSALFDLTEKYDGVRLKDLRVKEEEIKRASLVLDKSLKRTIALARKRIEEFHKKELPSGFLLKKRYCYVKKVFTPIETVGIYIPAGTSPLISTVLMTVIPAKIAGVKRIILVSPPKRNGKINPYILATASLCGIKEIYKTGGAQAIAALALGTETIPRVDKIIGPGNRYVTTAKRLLFGDVDIDLLAGPSEVVILADETAKASFVETDLSAQSEHTGG